MCVFCPSLDALLVFFNCSFCISCPSYWCVILDVASSLPLIVLLGAFIVLFKLSFVLSHSLSLLFPLCFSFESWGFLFELSFISPSLLLLVPYSLWCRCVYLGLSFFMLSFALLFFVILLFPCLSITLSLFTILSLSLSLFICGSCLSCLSCLSLCLLLSFAFSLSFFLCSSSSCYSSPRLFIFLPHFLL